MDRTNSVEDMDPDERSPYPAFVSVVIPCRNEVTCIDVCLQSVLSQDEPPGGFEVLIADGMSDDGTRERIQAVSKRDSRVRLIDNPKRIVSSGLNNAIRAARGAIIIRMDAHSEYGSDYVVRCVSALVRTGADNVGGPARTRAKGYTQRAISAAYHSAFSVGGARFHDEEFEGELDTVVYGCWWKETLLRIGLFDEELVRNQDDELNLRLTRGGGTVWQCPRIRSWYWPRSSLRELFIQYFQYGYWKVRVIQKHRIPASLRHLVPVLFVSMVGLGWLAAVVDPRALALYSSVLGTYTAICILYSIAIASRSGWELLPVLPPVFLAYHCGYGLGFAVGIVDFILLRSGPRAVATRLTRRVSMTPESRR